VVVRRIAVTVRNVVTLRAGTVERLAHQKVNAQLRPTPLAEVQIHTPVTTLIGEMLELPARRTDHVALIAHLERGVARRGLKLDHVDSNQSARPEAFQRRRGFILLESIRLAETDGHAAPADVDRGARRARPGWARDLVISVRYPPLMTTQRWPAFAAQTRQRAYRFQ
jgi:hypothetical protein